jgi:glycerophosphoryl diester phosphodiesterase
LNARTSGESATVLSQAMMPTDANQFGFVHGGAIMRLVDNAAGMVAMRHSRGRVATAAVDSLSFIAPARIGNLVTARACLTDVGHTSMEVEVEVEVEDPLTGRTERISSAHVVMVALDSDGRPTTAPPLAVSTDDERRRQAAARARRTRRAVERQRAAGAHPAPARPITPGGRPIVVGHRGAAGHAPENTLVAFERGLALGADVLECDVHLTRDGHLVVIHDDTLERTTNGSGPVSARTLDELLALDAGCWRGPEFAGQRIPTLPQLLDLARGRCQLAIEVKPEPGRSPRTGELEAALATCLRDSGLARDAFVISFDHEVVRRVRALCPDVTAGVLYVARPVDPVAMARAADATLLMPMWELTTPELIENAHAAGLMVFPWTANEPAAIGWLLSIGVDGVGSDYPDRVRAVVGAKR